MVSLLREVEWDFENVYIFDDCSNKQEIIEILMDAEGKGVNIFWNKRKSWSVDN